MSKNILESWILLATRYSMIPRPILIIIQLNSGSNPLASPKIKRWHCSRALLNTQPLSSSRHVWPIFSVRVWNRSATLPNPLTQHSCQSEASSSGIDLNQTRGYRTRDISTCKCKLEKQSTKQHFEKRVLFSFSRSKLSDSEN